MATIGRSSYSIRHGHQPGEHHCWPVSSVREVGSASPLLPLQVVGVRCVHDRVVGPERELVSGERVGAFGMRRPFYVPGHSVRYYKPGRWPGRATPGDLVLASDRALAARVIQFGQRLHLSRDEKQFALINHAATVVSSVDGVVVQEMTGGGGRLTAIQDWARGADPKSIAVVHVDTASALQRRASVRTAMWFVGVRYGWPSIVSDGLYCLTGIPVALTVGESVVCSAVASQSQRNLGMIPDKPDIAVMPSDLARYYNVKLPDWSTVRGSYYKEMH